MKPVQIFRHVACEGPGYLGTFLQRHNIPYFVSCVDTGISINTDIDAVSGLVFMGGGMNVTDPIQWIEDEKILIKEAIDANLPVMGICLGAQLIAAALGAQITHGPGMEIGWHPITKSPENLSNPWTLDLSDPVTVFHWHADTFSIPPGATPLLHSDCRKNQAFAIGNSLALQFHPEMTIEMVKEWVQLFGSDLKPENGCAQSQDEVLIDLEKRITSLHKTADIFFGKWISKLVDR